MWHVVSVTTAVTLAITSQLLAATAEQLDCYACGGLISTEEGGSCHEFYQALSWSLFRVTCDQDQICVKMTSLYPGEADREFRGCAERKSSFDLEHEMVCRRANISDSQTEFCFCDTYLCNGASSAHGSAAAAAALAGLLTAALLAAPPYR